MTWDDICAKVLADCGRCCCLCRRFRPIKLQVHHIVERSQGGKDEENNAIALCLMCHTDVHTKAPFTRRFSIEELKMHRDNVCRLVREGTLPAGTDTGSTYDVLPSHLSEKAAGALHGTQRPQLMPVAVRMLVAAASSDGCLMVTRTSAGNRFETKDELLIEDPFDPRLVAEYRAGLEQLRRHRLLEGTREVFMVTHQGFLLADELQAEAASEG